MSFAYPYYTGTFFPIIEMTFSDNNALQFTNLNEDNVGKMVNLQLFIDKLFSIGIGGTVLTVPSGVTFPREIHYRAFLPAGLAQNANKITIPNLIWMGKIFWNTYPYADPGLYSQRYYNGYYDWTDPINLAIDTNYITGIFDIESSTKINNKLIAIPMPYWAIKDDEFSKLDYSNNTSQLDILSVGAEGGLPRDRGWNISLRNVCTGGPDGNPCVVDTRDEKRQYPMGILNTTVHNGNIKARYMYPQLYSTTFFTNTTLAEFGAFLSTLPLNDKIGKSSLSFTTFAGCNSFLTKTALYLFIYYFYSQLYQYNEFSPKTTTINYFYKGSADKYNIITGIPTFIKEHIITKYDTIQQISKTFITLDPSTFYKLCIPPKVVHVDTNTNNVYLRCYLPIKIINDQFFNTSLPAQADILKTYLNNFFNESNDNYYTGKNSTANYSVYPFTFVLLDTSLNKATSIKDVINNLGNSSVKIGSSNLYANQVFFIDLVTNKINSLQGGNFDSTVNNRFFSSSTSPRIPSYIDNSDKPLTDPFFTHVSVTIQIVQWSPKVAAYCLSQFENDLSQSIVYNPPLPSPITDSIKNNLFYSIYINMSKSGWIPTALYTILKSGTKLVPSDPYTTKNILLNFCNTYKMVIPSTYSGLYQVYPYLYPWLMSSSSYGSDKNQTDCECVFNMIAPVGTPSPNLPSMCYNSICDKMPDSLKTAFGITSTACSSTDTCSTMNEWLTTSNPVNQSAIISTFEPTVYYNKCQINPALSSIFNPISIKKNKTQTSVITTGIILLILVLFCVIVACSIIRIRPLFTSILSILLIIGFSMVIYYLSVLSVGKWTCTKVSSTNTNINIYRPTCTSIIDANLMLSDEYCQDNKPVCECVTNTDCAFLGSVSPSSQLKPDDNGNCLYGTKDSITGLCSTPNITSNGKCKSGTDASGNCLVAQCVVSACEMNSRVNRPATNTTIYTLISYTSFTLLVSLSILLPLVFLCSCYVSSIRLSHQRTILSCTVLFLIPILYLVMNYSKPTKVSIYTDNPAMGGV